MEQIKSVTIAYFSGTGGTKMAADCFQDQLENRGVAVNKIRISTASRREVPQTDLLLLLSPVYAFRLAETTEKWVAGLPRAHTRTAVVSVSGGGEASPNSACRVWCKRTLEKKGYSVVYESMLVMPSNFAEPTPASLAAQLLAILPQKTERIVEDLLAEKKRLADRPILKDRVIAAVGRMEHLGARCFGVSLHASDRCTRCGKCVKDCPSENIRMENGQLKFGFRCVWCLHCIYTCPQGAISPRILKSVVLKDGFDLRSMGEQKTTPPPDSSWGGVVEYLKDQK